MSRYAHLLDNFQLADETRDVAADLIIQAKSRTGRGSGHELGEFDTGLPAVCALLASERLNTSEMSQKSAQAASCLKKKDFQRVYKTVQAVIEEFEKEEGVKSTYAKLHEKYNTSGMVEEKLKPYFTEVENELMTLATGYDHRSAMFRCLVYFWVCGAAKLKGVPSTVSFAQEHRLPMKKFTDILYLLNMRKLDLRKQIQAMFSKSGSASPSKQNVSTTATPRQTPRKAEAGMVAVALPESPSKASPTRSRAVEERQPEPQTPRRSQRTLVLQQESPSKNTPIKKTPRASASPTKIIQPPPPRLLFPNKGPLRELPSKDSPKKRTVHVLQEDDRRDEVAPPEEPPVKKMKVTVEESSTKMRTRSAAAIKAVEEVEAAVLKSPRKRKGGQAPSVLPEQPSPSETATKGKEEVAAHVDSASSDKESESDVSLTRRRYRPIYLEIKQWNARDPRLTKIWRKAEKRLNALMQEA